MLLPDTRHSSEQRSEAQPPNRDQPSAPLAAVGVSKRRHEMAQLHVHFMAIPPKPLDG